MAQFVPKESIIKITKERNVFKKDLGKVGDALGLQGNTSLLQYLDKIMELKDDKKELEENNKKYMEEIKKLKEFKEEMEKTILENKGEAEKIEKAVREVGDCNTINACLPIWDGEEEDNEEEEYDSDNEEHSHECETPGCKNNASEDQWLCDKCH